VTDDAVDLGPLADAGAKGLIVKCPIGTATVMAIRIGSTTVNVEPFPGLSLPAARRLSS